MSRTRSCLIFLCIAACLVGSLPAHDPGMSSAVLRLRKDHVELTLTFNNFDMSQVASAVDGNRDNHIDAAELAAGKALLIDAAHGGVRLTVDHRPVRLGASVVSLAEEDDIRFVIRIPCSGGSRYRFSTPLLRRLSRGHRQYACLLDSLEQPCGESLLTRQDNQLLVSVKKPAVQQILTPVVEGRSDMAAALLLVVGGLAVAVALLRSWFRTDQP